MRRLLEGKRLLEHRWAVGVGALILVFALGAASWAATDDAGTDPATAPAGGDDLAFGMGFGPGMGIIDGMGGPGGHIGGRGMLRGEIPEELKQQIQERREQMEARHQAILDLVREKMSPEDQQRLDQLIAEAEKEREALRRAGEDLRETATEIRGLVEKYLPATTTTTEAPTTEQ